MTNAAIQPYETRHLGGKAHLYRLGTGNINVLIKDEQGEVLLHRLALQKLRDEINLLLEENYQ